MRRRWRDERPAHSPARVALVCLTVAGLTAVAGTALSPLRLNLVTANSTQEQSASVVTGSATPAAALVSQVLDAHLPSAAGDLEPSGNAMIAASSPLVLTCSTGAAKAIPAPVVSVERPYRAAGVTGDFQVTLAAYSAGQGAAALQSLTTAAPACARNRGGAASPAGTLPLSPGGSRQTATLTAVTSGGAGAKVASWSRGDLVAYVATPGAAPSATALDAVVASLDAELAKVLSPVCANQTSTEADATRNPWVDKTSFTGLTRKEQVGVPQARLSAQAAALPVTAPDLAGPTAEVPAAPSYPVWPLMPTPLARPVLNSPTAPASTTEIAVQVEDTVGPGCGWSFTATAAPRFDAAVASSKADGDRAASIASLTSAQQQYAADMDAYAAAWPLYQQQASAYAAYRDQVGQVSAAWSVIADQWQRYNSALAAYTTARQAADDFLARQQDASAAYASAMATCTPAMRLSGLGLGVSAPGAVGPGSPSPTPTPTASPSPSATQSAPTASPSASASASTATRTSPPSSSASPQTSAPRQACPQRPLILDQAPPSVPIQPTPPADPRPVDQR